MGTFQVNNPSGVTQPLRYPGQYHDAETGLFYNMNRYYWPALGRYVQPDPFNLATFRMAQLPSAGPPVLGIAMARLLGQKVFLTNPAVQHLYTYVLNNPLLLVDPQGIQGAAWWNLEIPTPIPQCFNCANPIFERNGNIRDSSQRHCQTSCEISRECGNQCAFGLGWGFELSALFRRGAEFSPDDIRDNDRGRGCAAGQKPCEQCCQSKCP